MAKQIQPDADGGAGQPTSAVPHHLSFSSRAVPQNALSVRLLAAREAVMNHIRPILRTHSVTEQQYRILRTLEYAPALDNATLAQRACLLPPSVSRIMHDLRRAGLVHVEVVNRLTSNTLTARGLALARQVGAEIDALGAKIVQSVGEQRFRELMTALDYLEDRLSTLQD